MLLLKIGLEIVRNIFDSLWNMLLVGRMNYH